MKTLLNSKKITYRNSTFSPIEFHIKENQPKRLIGRIKHNSTRNVKFQIANERDVHGIISITPDGSIYSEIAFDREEKDTYRLTVIAEYTKGILSAAGIYQVTVNVDDENDNPPSFEHEIYEGKIKENCKSGTEVELNHQINASDPDLNSQVSINILGDGAEMFRLDKVSGKLYFNSALNRLDRENKDNYVLRLVAKDKGGLFSQAKLVISILDENDNAPVFEEMLVSSDLEINVLEFDYKGSRISLQPKRNAPPGVYSLSETHKKSRNKNKIQPIMSIPEDIAVGTTIFKLRAEDKDIGENALIKYELVSVTYIPNEKFSSNTFHIVHFFTVNPQSGSVSVARTLPPESEFRLNVSSSDAGGLKDFVAVKIYVKDVNDHPPVFKKSWYNFEVEETSFSRKILGKIEAIDSDFGQNANVTYEIIKQDKEFPFEISTLGGVLSVNGMLDREVKSNYKFMVLAKDNPKSGKSLSSSVSVDVNILDINDNAPVFYGYDDVLKTTERNKYPNHNFASIAIPVYYATAPENTPIGTPITKIFANDSDFSGNGNGLLLFDIPYRKNKENLFTIDSKEGIVKTIGNLDYERQRVHNVTIVASDLGSPSLSSTALLMVNVIDVPEDIHTLEHPVFAHRYYEVEVEENVPVPLKLLTLNVTEPYRNHKLRYSIVGDKNSEAKKSFKIDPRNGTLFIVESPDREEKALYELKIRLDQYKVGRDMTVMVYPVTNDRLGDLGLNEVKVIVRVIDVNDNVPKFTVSGRPFIAAVPTSANFGFHIIKLQVRRSFFKLLRPDKVNCNNLC